MTSPAQPGESNLYQTFFANLESRLAALSHTDEATQAIESAVAERFKKTSQRQIAFAQPNAICVEPILYSDAVASGLIGAEEDEFTILQGDIISTEAAYLMGERILGNPIFAVLNATCDLVPGRREYASLLSVIPIQGTGDELKATLHHLLSFSSRRDLYLPPLPNEDVPTLDYVIHFDRIAPIRMKDLLLARRISSLSLEGWRIFGSFARVLISRAGVGEASLRSKLHRRSLRSHSRKAVRSDRAWEPFFESTQRWAWVYLASMLKFLFGRTAWRRLLPVFGLYVVSLLLFSTVYWSLYRANSANYYHPDDVIKFHAEVLKTQIRADLDKSSLLLPSLELLMRAAAAARQSSSGKSQNDTYTFEHIGCRYTITLAFMLSSSCGTVTVHLEQNYSGFGSPLGHKEDSRPRNSFRFRYMASAGNRMFAPYLEEVLATHPDFTPSNRVPELKKRLAELENNKFVDRRDIYSYLDFVYASSVALSYGDIIPGSTTVRLLVVAQRICEIFLLVFVVGIVSSTDPTS